MKHSKKVGAITVEVAIGIALAVIVVIVALGLFSENLSNMISNSGIANMFKNSNKTTYSSFSKDYTNSQINVQLIGEQGLAMLRNIANNKALTQIDKYMDDTDTSVTNANSIAYLAIAINAIVGSPDICVYMKKDSVKKCDEDNIGGVAYYITLNGGSITINRKGGGITPKYPALGGDFSGGVAGITITKYIGGTPQIFQPAATLPTSYNPTAIGQTAIYKYIKELSFFVDESKTVYEHVILIKAINAATTVDDTQSLKTLMVNSLQNISSNFSNAHDSCTGCYLDGYFGCDGGWDMDQPTNNQPELVPYCGEPEYSGSLIFVSKNERNKVRTYTNEFIGIINSATSTNYQDIVDAILNNPDYLEYIGLLQNDHINGSCGAVGALLLSISDTYNISAEPSRVCVPYTSDRTP